MLLRHSRPLRLRGTCCPTNRLFGWLGLLAALLVLAACGGGTDDLPEQPMPAGVVRGQAAGSVATGSAADVTVEELTLKATRRVTRTVFEYDFEVTLLNRGVALGGVAVQIAATGAGTTIVDGTVQLDELPAGITVVRTDTVTLRHDRTLSFNSAALVWNVSGTAKPTSEELIDAALAAGEIDEQQALIYHVFAAFRDARLPEKYRGANSDALDSPAMLTLWERFETLAPETQALLEPFFTRPANVGSWLDTGNGAGAAATRTGGAGRKKAQSRPACETIDGWTSLNPPDAAWRVWYQSRTPGHYEKAVEVASLINGNVWPTLIGALGFKPPADDTGAGWCDGGDGKLDVYIVDAASMGDYGQTFAARFIAPYTSPAYILLRADLQDDLLKNAVSHEFMHAIHWAYNTKATQLSYRWFREALANWATAQVFPGNKYLNTMASCHLNSPQLALEDLASSYCVNARNRSRMYGAYLPLRFFSKTINANIVRSILEATQTYGTAEEAMDKTLPDGLAKHWPLFGLRLWNQEATEQVYGPATFKTWDGLSNGNAPVYKPVLAPDLPNIIVADLQGRPKSETALATELEHLSNKYYHFTFTEEATRSVIFHNTFQPKRKLGVKVSVRAYYKAENQKWKEEDWSDYEWIGFCRDFKEQRLEELVIVLSSAEWQPSRPKAKANEAPRLKRNNIGCWAFTGMVTRTLTYPSWNAGGKQELTWQAEFSEQANGEPTQYTDEDAGRLRVPLTGPGFFGGTWTAKESFSDGSCSFSLDQGGSEKDFDLGGSSGGQIVVNVFDEALPDDIRLAREGQIGAAGRAYSIMGVSTKALTGQASGPEECAPEGKYQSAFGNWLLTAQDPAKSPVVLPDGQMKGDFVAVDYGGGRQLKYTWDLKPKRQP